MLILGMVLKERHSGLKHGGSDRDWNFSYLGPDGTLDTADDIKSTGEMNLPVGAEVVIDLRSNDFIYVFSCPGLGLKEIAVPDLEFSISFTAERPGEFNLLMDPMCGFRLPPGETMGRIKVASASDFRQWLREH
jgi:heme/copper-type cytochrome/quinol oxidase subunit 2